MTVHRRRATEYRLRNAKDEVVFHDSYAAKRWRNAHYSRPSASMPEVDASFATMTRIHDGIRPADPAFPTQERKGS